MRLSILSLAIVVLCAFSPQTTPPAASPARLLAAVDAGQLAWQLSEPEEVAASLGEPQAKETSRDGGMEVLAWSYGPTFTVFFARRTGTSAPFVLNRARDGERWLMLPEGSQLRLRTVADLAKLPPFTGLQNVDVSKLDLGTEERRLRELTFDSRTTWPPADRLPKDFEPAALLREGTNPGLGVRALHAKGIDGRGVTIGIIDQPLRPSHVEIAGRLDVVAELEVTGFGPQMHGPAVTSLAAGTTCGVAPKARVRYVSMAMWKGPSGNQIYIDALERLLAANLGGKDRVRAVSISSGAYDGAPQAAEWRAALARAEAAGVLVITCDPAVTPLAFGLLKPLPGGDRERPDGYVKGSYGRGLLVPGDGRTFAHTLGDRDYVFGPTGGMSWGAPYLAGLAALGFQVNPTLTPARVRDYLVKSATKMAYGDVVNPAAFVEMCRNDPAARPTMR